MVAEGARVQICSSHTLPDLGRPGRSRGVWGVGVQRTADPHHTPHREAGGREGMRQSSSGRWERVA